jgi:hypothetical protein
MSAVESVLKPAVEITLDRPRKLVYDFNALAALEKETGLNTLDSSIWGDVNATNVRALLWAGLLWEDTENWTKPPSLTVMQVGAMLHPAKLREVFEKVGAAKNAGFPEPKDTADPQLAQV